MTRGGLLVVEGRGKLMVEEAGSVTLPMMVVDEVIEMVL